MPEASFVSRYEFNHGNAKDYVVFNVYLVYRLHGFPLSFSRRLICAMMPSMLFDVSPS